MASSAELIRNYRGPAILSFGFRPFFLFGAAWAAFVMTLWPAVLAGTIALPTAFDPVRWHAHELVYGYVPAVIAGFLLTAVPNWTGRLPVAGGRLLVLFALWGAGRVAVMLSAITGAAAAAAVDLLFLTALGATVTREIVAGKSIQNLKVLVVLAVLLAGNAVSHVELLMSLRGGYGIRLGVAAIVMLILLIGGRIIPSFTRDWLVRRGPGRLPQPFGRFDIVAVAIAGAALLLWVAAPGLRITASCSLAAAIVHFWRLARWAGERTRAEPLVTILHVGYAFVPAGFALLAFAIVRPDIINETGAMHAWTAGAIGTMTLAVMTRASLGHTGQPLTADIAVQLIYAAILISGIARIAAGFGIAYQPMLYVSVAAWVVAFAGFAAVFGPLLSRPRSRAA